MMKRLHDQSGASIVIALVFFTICLVVGGVVVTAASVAPSATQKAVKTQQAEYDVGCAAQALADQMRTSQIDVRVVATDGVKTTSITKVAGTDLARDFWKKQGAGIMANCDSNKLSTFNDVAIAGGSKDVRGQLTVDENLNMTFTLKRAGDDSYAMTVYLKSIPTFDHTGRLKSFGYEAPVIQKTADASNGGA